MKAVRILSRNIRDSFKSVFRNFSLSLASISCITITLIVVAISIVLSQNVNTFAENVEKDVTIVVFLDVDIEPEQKDDVEDLHIEVSEGASVKTYKDLSRKQKVLKIVLIILSIISIYVGLFFVAIAVESGSNLTYLESTYYQILNAWKFLIALPLPLASLAYGIYLYIKGYKFKGNIIFGIIFTGIILIYGIGFSSMKKTYLTDTMYLDKIEENVKINLPDDVFILTQDNTGTVQTNEQNVFINFVSSIRLEENLVLDEKWKDGFANMKPFVLRPYPRLKTAILYLSDNKRTKYSICGVFPVPPKFRLPIHMLGMS